MEKEHELLGQIATALDEIVQEEFGRELGFCILLFEFGGPGIGNYAHNASRDDMIKCLRETADRLEAREDIPPAIGSVQ